MDIYVGKDTKKAQSLLDNLQKELKEELDLVATIKKIEEAKYNLVRSVEGMFENEKDEEYKRYMGYLKKVLPQWIRKEIDMINKELNLLKDGDKFIKSVLKASKDIAESSLKQKIFDGWAANERKIILKEYNQIESLNHFIKREIEGIEKYLGTILEHLNKETDIINKPIKDLMDYEGEIYQSSGFLLEGVEEQINEIIKATKNLIGLLKDEELRKIIVEKCEYVTKEVVKLKQKYGGRVEYGVLGRESNDLYFSEDGISWRFSYDVFFGSSDKGIGYAFDAKRKLFVRSYYGKKGLAEEVTDNPKEVVEFYRKFIEEEIPRERKEHLIKYFYRFGKARINWKMAIEDFKEQIIYDKENYNREVYTKKEVEAVLKELKCPGFYMEDALSVLG